MSDEQQPNGSAAPRPTGKRQLSGAASTTSTRTTFFFAESVEVVEAAPTARVAASPHSPGRLSLK